MEIEIRIRIHPNESWESLLALLQKLKKFAQDNPDITMNVSWASFPENI